MSSSFLDYAYRINGVVSTDKTVMQNLDSLCNACNTWLTYDTHDGLWSVVINQESDSVASFTDSNIIGPINISGTGINDIYNSVRVQFPHIDLRDEIDYVFDSIPTADRYPNEIDNTLDMQFDIINDPVQAEYVGLVSLKQARVDLVINFKTDFSQLGLKAGDVIDITSSIYGFTNKKFRITSLKETDADDGSIEIDVTALEYDANVYSTDDLTRYTRTNSTGITTIGDIGTPGTPTVSKFEKDARPRVSISSTTPTGRVEQMEFWATTSTAPDDANRNYYLLDVVRPSQGNTFPFGTVTSISNDTLAAGNLYVKTRGVNSATVGSFSAPSGFVYTPVQTTNNIDENTTASTSTGSLVTALGALTLLNNLDNLFSGNVANGSLFTKVFDLFSSNTGLDLRGKANTLSNVVTAAESGTISGDQTLLAISKDVTFTPGTGATLSTTPDPVFTVATNSKVLIDMQFNFGGSGSSVPCELLAQMWLKTGNVVGSGTTIESDATNTNSADQYSDLSLMIIADVTAGDYNLDIFFNSNVGATLCGVRGTVTSIPSAILAT